MKQRAPKKGKDGTTYCLRNGVDCSQLECHLWRIGVQIDTRLRDDGKHVATPSVPFHDFFIEVTLCVVGVVHSSLHVGTHAFAHDRKCIVYRYKGVANETDKYI